MKKYKIIQKTILLLMAIPFSLSIATAQISNFEKSYKLIEFSKLDIDGNFQVFVTLGTEYSVRIVNDSAINAKENNIAVSEKKGKLSISYIGNNADSKGVNIHLNMPNIEEIKLTDKVQLHLDNMKIGDVKIATYGQTKISGKLIAQDIKLVMKDKSTIILEGQAGVINMRTSDNVRFKGGKLKAREIVLRQNGDADLSLNATNSLKINSKGVGEINYVGSPDQLSLNKKGSVSINQIN